MYKQTNNNSNQEQPKFSNLENKTKPKIMLCIIIN